MFDMNEFGNNLRKIRRDLNLSQSEACELSGVDTRTIGRLENAQNPPRLDTLDMLSKAYEVNLLSLLDKCYVDEKKAFNDLLQRIDFKLNNFESGSLNIELGLLNELLISSKKDCEINQIKQMIFFVEACILHKDYDTLSALEKYIDSLKILKPDFDLKKIDSFIYSPRELRILMNISFELYRQGLKKDYLKILEFCVDSTDVNDGIYPKMCYNLATAYMRNNNLKKEALLINEGIKHCRKKKLLDYLPIFFYMKGVSEYYFRDAEHINSFNKSVFLCDCFGQDNLKNIIIEKCEQNFGIDLKYENFQIVKPTI